MYTDPISDLINQIKMGIKAKKSHVTLNSSKQKINILTLLKVEGYIKDFKVQTVNKISKVVVSLKYFEGVPSITGIKQISKPGLRVYVQADKMPRILNGLGIAIISTNKGLMSSKTASRHQVGGEVIAYVW